MKDYPIYAIAKTMECNEQTVIRLIKKYNIDTFRRNDTRFVASVDLIKMLTMPMDDCQKYLSRIYQNT